MWQWFLVGGIWGIKLVWAWAWSWLVPKSLQTGTYWQIQRERLTDTVGFKSSQMAYTEIICWQLYMACIHSPPHQWAKLWCLWWASQPAIETSFNDFWISKALKSVRLPTDGDMILLRPIYTHECKSIPAPDSVLHQNVVPKDQRERYFAQQKPCWCQGSETLGQVHHNNNHGFLLCQPL